MLTTKACATPRMAARVGGSSRASPVRDDGWAPIPRARRCLRARATDAVSGEWPVTWSLASYEDVGQYFSQNVFKVRG
jgi:hypothetical protein